MAEQQEKLIDVDIPAAPEIKRLAREYAEARDNRMELGRDEVDLRGKLLALMHEHDLKTFESDGLCVEIVVPDEKIKVKVPGDESEVDEAGE